MTRQRADRVYLAVLVVMVVVAVWWLASSAATCKGVLVVRAWPPGYACISDVVLEP